MLAIIMIVLSNKYPVFSIWEKIKQILFAHSIILLIFDTQMFYPMSISTLRKCNLLVVALLVFSFCSSAQQTYSVYSCSGSTFNFVQPGAPTGTTYTWGTPVISQPGAISNATAAATPQNMVVQSLTNNTTSQATATYLVTTSNNTNFTLVVTVNPQPQLSTPTNAGSICSGDLVTYTPNSPVSGTSFNWSRPAIAGISNISSQGTGNPNEILYNTTTNPIDVTYNYTLSANGCSNNQAVIVTVKPQPSLTTPLIASSICSGGTAVYTPASNIANTSFTWTRAVVSGISAGPGNNSGPVNEQLNNTTLLPKTVTYVYTLTANNYGCSNKQNVYLTVNPVPSVSNPPAVNSCSGNIFMITPSPVPAGTTYTWQAPVISPAGAITGGGTNTIGQNYIGQALTNNSGSTATATYTVTPSSYGCVGTSFTATVNVNPGGSVATLSSSLTPPDICSGTTFFYHPTSAAPSPSFSWTRFVVAGISQGATTGNGDINDPLNNNTYAPVTVKYAITTTSNGCSNTQDIAVIVNPSTSLSTTLTPTAICSNTQFSYTPASATPNTSFNWTRPAVIGISNGAASGTGNPNETLINTTSVTVQVTYTYNLITPNGCTNNQSVVVNINPTPTLSSTQTPNAVCSGSTFNYIPNSATAGATYTWNRAVVTSISNGAGNGTYNPAEILVNTSLNPVNVPYTYTISANNCSSTAIVTVPINPVPNIANQTLAACSNTVFNLIPVSVPSNTTYTWTAPVIAPVGAISGGSAQTTGQASISQLLTNQTINSATATYTVTPTAAGCTGASFTAMVTLNPVPAVANQLLAAICSGNAFSYTPASMPAGTTYTWSNPLLAPASGLTGGSAQPISQTSIGQSLSSVNNIMDTATYTVTPSTNGCAGNTFTVTVPVKPVPILFSMTDTICSGTPFSILPSPVPANTTYTWPTPVVFPFGSVINGGQQTTPVPTISQTLVNTTAATGQVVYTITPVATGCTGAPFTLTAVVGVPLPPIANQSTIICSGTSFNMTPATAPPGTTYTWSVPVVSPAGSVLGLSAAVTPQTIISQTLTNLINVNDTVVYFVRPYNTGCQGNIFTATVRVMPSPKANITGKAVICAYPQDTLSISFTGNAPWSFNYTDTTGVSRTVSGIKTSPYTWITPSLRNATSQTFAISGVKEMACSNFTDTFYFSQRINHLPVGKIVSLHGNYICNNILDTLYVVSLPSDTVSYQWLLNGVPITGATTDSIGTLTPGKYNARLTNQFGCVDTAASNLGLILINKPILKLGYDSYCINKLIHFTNLTDTTFTGTVQWLWNLGDSTSANTYHATDTYLTGGDRHIRLTATQANCASYSVSLDTTFTIQVPIAAVRLPSISAYKSVPTMIAGRYLPGYTYQWNPTRGITSPNSDSTIFNHSQTQQYLVNLISSGGCYTPDTLLVRVFDNNMVDILVPRSFTPNGDGVNDILYSYHAGLKEFHYFKIYNRYGQLMFETRDPDAGWNGTAGGTAQPMGIYIWIAEGLAVDGSLVRKTGETLLLR